VPAGILQEPRPTSEARRDLENRFAWEEEVNAGKERTPPLGFRAAPGSGPLLPLLRPIVVAVPALQVFLDRRHDGRLLTPFASAQKTKPRVSLRRRLRKSAFNALDLVAPLRITTSVAGPFRQLGISPSDEP